MDPLTAWTEQVCAELGLTDVDAHRLTRQVLDLARDVAHAVDRPAAPVTAYLVGLAAGRATQPGSGQPGAGEPGPGQSGPGHGISEVTDQIVSRVTALVEGWTAAPRE
jgi:hypothetical protein